MDQYTARQAYSLEYTVFSAVRPPSSSESTIQALKELQSSSGAILTAGAGLAIDNSSFLPTTSYSQENANPSGVNNAVNQETPNPQVILAQIAGSTQAAFVLTVSGTLTIGTYVAPTLEATTSSTLFEIKARVRTVSSSGSVIIALRKNNSVFGYLSIPVNSHTGLITSSSITSLKNDQVDIDIISAGTGTKDLSVFVRVQ